MAAHNQYQFRYWTGGLLWFRQTAPVPNPVLLVKSPLLEIDHLPVVRNVNAVSAAVCKYSTGLGFVSVATLAQP